MISPGGVGIDAITALSASTLGLSRRFTASGSARKSAARAASASNHG